MPSDDRREALFRKLDYIEAIFATIGRAIFGVMMIAIVAVAVIVFVNRPLGAGNQGEYFYFGVIVLLALGWTWSQYVSVRRRLQRLRGEEPDQPSVVDWLGLLAAAKGSQKIARTTDGWTAEISDRCELAREDLPDEATLDKLESDVAAGVDLDVACRLQHPKYTAWSALQQHAFRFYVETVFEQRRRAS